MIGKTLLVGVISYRAARTESGFKLCVVLVELGCQFVDSTRLVRLYRNFLLVYDTSIPEAADTRIYSKSIFKHSEIATLIAQIAPMSQYCFHAHRKHNNFEKLFHRLHP